LYYFFFFFSSRRRHTRWPRDWSSDVCSSDLSLGAEVFPMNNKITSVQLSSDVLYPRAKSKALSRITILGALIAAFVNVRLAQVRSEERRVGKECRCRWWSGQ